MYDGITRPPMNVVLYFLWFARCYCRLLKMNINLFFVEISSLVYHYYFLVICSMFTTNHAFSNPMIAVQDNLYNRFHFPWARLLYLVFEQVNVFCTFHLGVNQIELVVMFFFYIVLVMAIIGKILTLIIIHQNKDLKLEHVQSWSKMVSILVKSNY